MGNAIQSLPVDRKLSAIISHWHNYLACERCYSVHTVDGYIASLGHFLRYLHQVEGAQITLRRARELALLDFKAWLNYRHSFGYSPRSTARSLAAVKSFFRFCASRFGLEVKDLYVLRPPAMPASIPRFLTQAQAISVIDAIGQKNAGWVGKRDKALLALLYGSGLRISEALSLNPRDLHGDEIRVIGKGKKERLAILLPKVKRYISRYTRSCPHNLRECGVLFVGVRGKPLQPALFQRTLKAVAKELEIPGEVTPHCFRHSFATHLLNNGADLRSIQELLGHDSIGSTQIYAHATSKMLLENYYTSHPRA